MSGKSAAQHSNKNKVAPKQKGTEVGDQEKSIPQPGQIFAAPSPNMLPVDQMHMRMWMYN